MIGYDWGAGGRGYISRCMSGCIGRCSEHNMREIVVPREQQHGKLLPVPQDEHSAVAVTVTPSSFGYLRLCGDDCLCGGWDGHFERYRC